VRSILVLTNFEALINNIIVADHKFIERVGTIQPHDLGTFLVEVQRILRIVTITDEMRAALVKPQTEEQMQFDQSALINPTTVDEDTYSKGGITSAIEYDKPLHFGRSYR
jgi:hypothetical protein